MADEGHPWTKDEFRVVGVALWGGTHGWQTGLAGLLKVTPRTVRNWAAGKTPVPAGVRREIMGLMGAADTAELKFRRDEWFLGDSPPDEAGRRREYLVHTWPPRFICRVVEIDEDTGKPVESAGEVEAGSGIFFQANPVAALAEFQWIDGVPEGPQLVAVLEVASDFLESETELAMEQEVMDGLVASLGELGLDDDD